MQIAILLGLTYLNPRSMASFSDSTSAWKFLVNWFNSAIKTGRDSNVTDTASSNVTDTASSNVTDTASSNVTDTASSNVTDTASSNVTDTASSNILKQQQVLYLDTASSNVPETASSNILIQQVLISNVTDTASSNVTDTASSNVTDTASSNVTDTASYNILIQQVLISNVTDTASSNVTDTASSNVTDTASSNVTDTASSNVTDTASSNYYLYEIMKNKIQVEMESSLLQRGGSVKRPRIGEPSCNFEFNQIKAIYQKAIRKMTDVAKSNGMTTEQLQSMLSLIGWALKGTEDIILDVYKGINDAKEHQILKEKPYINATAKPNVTKPIPLTKKQQTKPSPKNFTTAYESHVLIKSDNPSKEAREILREVKKADPSILNSSDVTASLNGKGRLVINTRTTQARSEQYSLQLWNELYVTDHSTRNLRRIAAFPNTLMAILPKIKFCGTTSTILTGHGFVKADAAKLSRDDPTYPHCHEEDQTVDHLLFRCPAYHLHRFQTATLLGINIFAPEDLQNIPKHKSAWRHLINWMSAATIRREV
ncbi:hypothetical protein LAZ67_5000551 [Cordylochernes scorpioides]|uniref:Reverse transcriptase zinc-binding domain-containing protein n=1 Tax=Cordylochernes scorpioides TaxID=51811 RepID=A0ABY6KJT5_9ARAC|nr:hypothetical protein LAZ67_5000551 [Cordylochernes scorpioides]